MRHHEKAAELHPGVPGRGGQTGFRTGAVTGDSCKAACNNELGGSPFDADAGLTSKQINWTRHLFIDLFRA